MKLLKLTLLFLFTTSVLAASGKPTYKCYTQKTFEFCVPAVGKGKSMFIPYKVVSDIASAKSELEVLLKQPDIKPVESPDSRAETDFLKDNPEFKLASPDKSFGTFISSQFNQSAGFSGPNCYNTVLLVNGILPEDQQRYVSLKEFKFYLKHYFEPVYRDNTFRDVLVYDANFTKDHVAVYLFKDLVFHKKGFKKEYTYRILPFDKVYKIEPYEWVPSIFDGGPRIVDDTRALQNIAKYRKKESSPASLAPDLIEKSQLEIIRFLNAMVFRHSSNWSAGREMGMISENIMTDLLKEFKELETSRSLTAQKEYLAFHSMSDQLFQSIEETHFSSRYASARPDKIRNEICVHYNDYLKTITKMLLDYFGKISDNAAIEKVFNKIKTFDRKRCRINLVKIIKS